MNYPNQFNINTGFGIPFQPQSMMSQQLNNNMFMMNNYSQIPMNLGYPQQQQFNNNPNANYNQNLWYNMHQLINNQNIPQQNKAANSGSVLGLF